MRDEFTAIVDGWWRLKTANELQMRVHDARVWADRNGPLTKDERRALQDMEDTQLFLSSGMYKG